jgi:hypothetical protein
MMFTLLLCCKRDRQRAHAARAANNQQRFIRVRILNVQPFEQPSQAVSAVNGNAAAAAQPRLAGLCPTIRASIS